MNPSTSAAICGARILSEDGTVGVGDLVHRNGIIVDIGPGVGCSVESRVDAGGALLLPGIVDLHGDAFERQIMPRPGVFFPIDLALRETDSQLIANGITTAFHGVTWSWEPGLRGNDIGAAIVEAIHDDTAGLRCDTRIHLRMELFNLAGLDQALNWVDAGKIAFLAFNDHFDLIYLKRDREVDLAEYLDRTGLSTTEFRSLLDRIADNRAARQDVMGQLSALAGARGIAVASHDDESPEDRSRFRALGSRISEFPVDVATARAARAGGDIVVLGAPNVVRGGSHTKRLRAAEAVGQGLCDVLVSDYYYPSLLAAPFALAANDRCSFADAWRLVSANPAAAAGLTDRGAIAPGLRADVILVDDSVSTAPRPTYVLAGGRTVLTGTR